MLVPEMQVALRLTRHSVDSRAASDEAMRSLDASRHTTRCLRLRIRAEINQMSGIKITSTYKGFKPTSLQGRLQDNCLSNLSTSLTNMHSALLTSLALCFAQMAYSQTPKVWTATDAPSRTTMLKLTNVIAKSIGLLPTQHDGPSRNR
jgi:hypothetical protein